MVIVVVAVLSHVQLFCDPTTVALQALPSMEFLRQEYWSGLPVPYPGDFPNTGIKPGSPTLQADSLSSEPPQKPVTLVFPPLLSSRHLPSHDVILCICLIIVCLFFSLSPR